MDSEKFIKQNDILIAFSKATLANIPVYGNYVNEGINLIEKAISEKNLKERFDLLNKIILEITPNDKKNNVAELLKTYNFNILINKLNKLYFSNGSEESKSYEVFVYAWYNNAFPEIKTLSNQEKLTFLVYISSSIAGLVNDWGKEYLSNDALNKLIELIYRELSNIDKEGVRLSDLAALYLYLSRFQFRVARYKEAAHTLMSCLENSIYAGIYQIGILGAPRSFSFPRPSIVQDLGTSFNNMGMYNLARIVYRDAYNMYKKKGLLTNGSLKCLISIAESYVVENKILESIKVYEEYLQESKLLLEDDFYKNNNVLWSNREYASFFIMENKIPKPDINQKCLCGSDKKYKECCIDLSV